MNTRRTVGQLGVLGVGILLGGCATAVPVGTELPASTQSSPTRSPNPVTTATALAPIPAATPTASTGLSPLPVDGPVAPGRYRYVVDNSCDSPDCPEEGRPASPLNLEITIPTGYATFEGFPVISLARHPGTNGPDGGALVLGWTSFWVGLNSDPCLAVGHEIPDVPVGPAVDDFVDAVVAQPALDVTEPTDAQLGGYGGKFFTLTGPSDISGCDNWRPWDPGFFVQGEDNIWDVWVIDADGFRVLIVNEYFPGTPDQVKSELRAMAESIRFVP